GRMLREIMEVYPPREPVDVDQLSDMVSSVLEGCIVLSKTLKEPNTLAEQEGLQRIAGQLARAAENLIIDELVIFDVAVEQRLGELVLVPE
ncbi:hypothetical protein AB9F41_34520, partial [Rhizobium leguminosarum]